MASGRGGGRGAGKGGSLKGGIVLNKSRGKQEFRVVIVSHLLSCQTRKKIFLSPAGVVKHKDLQGVFLPVEAYNQQSFL